MKFGELEKAEAQIGFTAGILVGALGAGIMVIFFTNLAWYWKLISGIGSVGILGSLTVTLLSLIQMRRQILQAQKLVDDLEKCKEVTA